MKERNSHDQFFSAHLPDPITWTNNTVKLFTTTDVNHMKQVNGGSLDLSSYASVKIYASLIYTKVSTGEMPPSGSGENAWTPSMVNTFGCWIQQGCQQ